jgi:Na+-driven multidrug efflux pump
MGAGAMTFCSVLFICFGHVFTSIMTNVPAVADLAARCLFITAFTQPGFAAAIIFAGALRGAGDTFWVMILNLTTIIFVRLAGVLVVGWWLHMGLAVIWVILASELSIRGVLVFVRFQHGGWKHARV